MPIFDYLQSQLTVPIATWSAQIHREGSPLKTRSSLSYRLLSIMRDGVAPIDQLEDVNSQVSGRNDS